MTKLYYRGGKNVDEVVNKIMRQIFTNSLACSYSYLGKQKKKPFYNLVLCKCVLGKFCKIIINSQQTQSNSNITLLCNNFSTLNSVTITYKAMLLAVTFLSGKL